MSLQEKLLEDMKTAMKSGDKVFLETRRMLRAQVNNFRINKLKEIVIKAVNDADAESLRNMDKVMSVLMLQVKGRADGRVVQEMVNERLN